jgi:poly(A) polymerase
VTAIPGVREGRLVDPSLLRDGPLARALAALNGEGEETRLVGGAVRDIALGMPHGDFDLATTALPEVVTRRARAAGFPVIPTGLAHGTVTVMVEGKPFETTTLREDVETFGRHATVLFGRDFEADALRRDFTINALSVDVGGAVHDYCGGLDDLAAKRVRFIGEARTRIREDYLRILRFFRFSARFATGELDPEGLLAAITERDGLEFLSRERVRAELLKLLVAPRAADVMETVAETGLAGIMFAGLADPARLKRAIGLEAQFGEPPDPLVRLGALGVMVREDAERLREQLRLSNAEYERLEGVARALEAQHGLKTPPALGDLRILLFERGRQGARDAILFAAIDAGSAGDAARFASACRFVSDTPIPRLPFSGADILARGVGPGREVGAILKRLQAGWIRAGFPKEPEVLARLLDEATRG